MPESPFLHSSIPSSHSRATTSDREIKEQATANDKTKRPRTTSDREQASSKKYLQIASREKKYLQIATTEPPHMANRDLRKEYSGDTLLL